MGILQRTERSTVRAMHRAQLTGRKKAQGWMLMLGLNEAIDHLAMASSVYWDGHVLRREDSHV